MYGAMTIYPKIIEPDIGFKDLDEFVITCSSLPSLESCPIIDIIK